MRNMMAAISVLFVAQMASAASHYVRAGATGNGSGSDWTNAYTNLPLALVRGDTYYLADGSYGSYTFDDGGTAVITVRKATGSDHGTETGWQNTYGDGQAVFTHWDFHADYYEINGLKRNSNWQSGALDQYGIKVAGAGPLRLDNGGGTGGDNIIFRYVDFEGGGRDTQDGDDVVYGLAGNGDITFQFCALHESDRTIFLMRGNWRNLLVDHCYIARNTSTPATHGEMLSTTEGTNVVFSNNIIEDIEGTAVFAFLNNGTANNWKIFGNVVFHTQSYITNARGTGHNYGIAGFVYVANDASNSNSANNFAVHNNTFYHMQGINSGVFIQAGTGNTVHNNLWHSSARASHDQATTDYNFYYSTPNNDNGPHTQALTNGNIFIKTTDKPDLHLATPAGAGTSLGLPFNVDLDGNSRGADGVWDCGAYEFTAEPGIKVSHLFVSAARIPVHKSHSFDILGRRIDQHIRAFGVNLSLKRPRINAQRL